MRWVGNALTRRKGVRVFGSVLLRREGVRGFRFGIGCLGVIQMTRDGWTGRDRVNRGRYGHGHDNWHLALFEMRSRWTLPTKWVQ